MLLIKILHTHLPPTFFTQTAYLHTENSLTQIDGAVHDGIMRHAWLGEQRRKARAHHGALQVVFGWLVGWRVGKLDGWMML